MDDERKETEQYIADTITERPHFFSVDGTLFPLYPLTLGRILLLQGHLESLGIPDMGAAGNMTLEALRLAREKREDCVAVIALFTLRGQEELTDAAVVSERNSLLSRSLSDEDIASLMLVVLRSDNTGLLMQRLGIEKEQEKMGVVMKVKSKSDRNNLVFGGKSQFGSLIDAACERYGWTKQYVVWGIDYTSLRLMLADRVNSIYCSDDELKRLPASVRNTNDVSIRPTRENMNTILSMDWR